MRWFGLIAGFLFAFYGSHAEAQTVNCQIPYQFSNLAFQDVAVCIDTILYRDNSNALTFYVATAANGGANSNDCLAAAVGGRHGPCLTLQHAVDLVSRYNFNGSNAAISIGMGSFAGAMISGGFWGIAGNGVSGQYLNITGSGSASTTITQISGQLWDLELSQHAGVVYSAMTISVPSGGYGIAAQNGAFAGLGDDLKFVGATGAVVAIYGEAGAILERNASGITTTIQGEFQGALIANTGAHIEFDPGGTSTFSAGSGLTIPGGGAFATASLGGKIQWNVASNSGTVTGEVARVFAGGIISITSGSATIPGDGVTRNAGGFLVDGVGIDLLTPTLGTCANGALAGQDTNYEMQINFTGVNTTCAVLFGKLSGSSAAFSANPRCVGVIDDGGATKFIGITTVSTAGFTIVPSLAMANNQAIYVHCLPPSGG